MTFPSFPTVASERQLRTALPRALRSETPSTERASASSKTPGASQGEVPRASVGTPIDRGLAQGERIDELDLSPEALAFLLGTPPLAGSQETSEFPEKTQSVGQSSPEPSDIAVPASEEKFVAPIEEQENHFTTDADSSTSAEVVEEANTAAEAQEESAEQDPEAKQKSNDSDQLAPEEEELVERLSERDREVRTHEQAHMNAAGAYAKGGPTYTYQQGPDGKQYAVGGEVQIDTSPVPNDPEATIRKAQVVRAAALAPAEPSSQDKAVASAATKMQQQAQSELVQQRMKQTNGEENQEEGDKSTLQSEQDTTPDDAPETSSTNSSSNAQNPQSQTPDEASDEIRGSTAGVPSTERGSVPSTERGSVPSAEPGNVSQYAPRSFDATYRESAFLNEASRAYAAQTGHASPNTRTMPSGRSEVFANPSSSHALLDVRW